jgi:hypothetical protein
MDVEIAVPQTPVVLTPGDETRVRIEVCNRSVSPMSVRLSVARSRAGAWSHAEPPTLDLAAGDCDSAEVVFRPPANVLPTSALQPFTVQAEDLRYGVVTGRATGLLGVGVPQPLTAALTRESDTALCLSVTNRGEAPVTLRLDTRLDPPRGDVRAEPTVLDVPRGETASARIRVRPPARLVGAPVPYSVVVSGLDTAADDAAPLVTAEEHGTAQPRLRGRGVVAVLCVLAVLGLVVTLGRLAASRGLGRPAAPAPVATPTSTARPAAAVRHPYALVDAFPRQEGPAGRGAAEAALARLTAAGMPVRMVDNTTSTGASQRGGGLLVIVQDGFASIDEARGFCDRFRAVAPKCIAVP